jgi:(p)ppGpp synthase/HD superfamily hydrolase
VTADLEGAARSVGTDALDHHGRPLTMHLLGTSQRLATWGKPQHIVAAGMFHSICGTKEFRTKALSLERRAEVRGLIYERAEELAYLCGLADRNTIFKAPTSELTFRIVLPAREARSRCVKSDVRRAR